MYNRSIQPENIIHLDLAGILTTDKEKKNLIVYSLYILIQRVLCISILRNIYYRVIIQMINEDELYLFHSECRLLNIDSFWL